MSTRRVIEDLSLEKAFLSVAIGMAFIVAVMVVCTLVWAAV